MAPQQRLWCRTCNKLTEHEREETLPGDVKTGDPGHEDRSKCGQCGEHYVCDDCGQQWDVERNECSAVVERGQHGPEE